MQGDRKHMHLVNESGVVNMVKTHGRHGGTMNSNCQFTNCY